MFRKKVRVALLCALLLSIFAYSGTVLASPLPGKPHSHQMVLSIRNVNTGETTIATPGLTAVGSTLYLAWTGTDSGHHLNIMQSSNGSTFTNKTTLTDGSPDGPSLTNFNGLPYVAFEGGESNHPIHLGWYNHTNLLRAGTVINKTTIARPSLASFNGKVYVAWVASTDNHIHIGSSSNPAVGSSFNDLRLSDAALTGPTLAVFNGHLYVSFVGTDNNNLHIGYFVDGNSVLQNGKTLPDTGVSETGLQSFTSNNATKIWLAWLGTDFFNSQNYASSTDGKTFGNKVTNFGTGGTGQTLASFNGHLYLAYQPGSGSLTVDQIA